MNGRNSSNGLERANPGGTGFFKKKFTPKAVAKPFSPTSSQSIQQPVPVRPVDEPSTVEVPIVAENLSQETAVKQSTSAVQLGSKRGSDAVTVHVVGTGNEKNVLPKPPIAPIQQKQTASSSSSSSSQSAKDVTDLHTRLNLVAHAHAPFPIQSRCNSATTASAMFGGPMGSRMVGRENKHDNHLTAGKMSGLHDDHLTSETSLFNNRGNSGSTSSSSSHQEMNGNGDGKSKNSVRKKGKGSSKIVMTLPLWSEAYNQYSVRHFIHFLSIDLLLTHSYYSFYSLYRTYLLASAPISPTHTTHFIYVAVYLQ